MRLTRRGLLLGAAAGGGLAVAWAVLPRSFAPPLSPDDNEAAFGAWLTIASDGVVTVSVPQLEMGQGVTTLIPQLVAQELGADWRQVAAQPAPVSGAYANTALAARWASLWEPVFADLADEPDDFVVRRFAEDRRFMATAAGTTLDAYEIPAREAAAAARAMLCMAAADRWNVAWEECEVANGFVRHGEKRFRFGELAVEAASYDPPDPPPLEPTPPREVPTEMGADAAASLDFPRLDLPAKVDGTFQFAGDVRLPGMLYAAIRHGPLQQDGALSRLANFDKPSIVGLRGVEGIVRGGNWLAAVARDWWTAERAVSAMTPQFTVDGPLDSEAMEARIDEAVRGGEGARIATRGDGDDSFDRTDIALRYDVQPAVHATPETSSVTARLTDGRLELWAASQAPEQARNAVSDALGMSERNIVLYPMPAGGSFDRRLDHRQIVHAALIARETGRPVQLILSRWQEQLSGLHRQPCSALLTAKLGAGGVPTHWRARIAAPPAMKEMGRRLFSGGGIASAKADVAGQIDPLVCEGAMPPYGIPNVAVDHIPVDVGVPLSRMRGGSDGYTAFFTECFIDELAQRARREPLSFRLGLLGDDKRLFECLRRAARLAEWDGGVDRSGQGLACHRMGSVESGGCIALVATARAGEGGLRVEKLTAAVDIGRIVNLDLARQQIEGGLLFGLSLAVGSAVTYTQGLPNEGRLRDLNLPSLAEAPDIEVSFVDSDAPAFDPGEIGMTVAAPAIANALHSATGLRLRRLPLLAGAT